MNPRRDLAARLAELAGSNSQLAELDGQSASGKTAPGQSTTGKQYWRSLEELAESDAFQEMMKLEFPEQADVWPDALSRRKFLTLMGASLALAGLSGCSVKPAPVGKILPYVRPPRDIVPGQPLFFATTMPFAGGGVGLLVESHMGRPTKIEGNPDHPASGGATNILHQASILTLYDPDRSKTVTNLGRTRTWNDAAAVIRSALEQQRSKGGAGVRILSESIISPTLAEQRRNLMKSLPQAKWHVYEPVHRDAEAKGTRLAFGEPLQIRYDFKKADVVLSLDSDFLLCTPGNLRWVSDFMSGRRVRGSADDAKQAKMNRLYVVETAVTNTGVKADHRLALPAAEIEGFARLLTSKLGIVEQAASLPPQTSAPIEKWSTAVAKDLQQHRGRCLILVGERQPAAVHLLAHALNQQLGNVGQTVFYADPIEDLPVDRTASLRELVQDIDQGHVEFLFVLDANPVYTAPVDFDFVKHFEKVPLRVHLGLFQDETARYCHWHLPEAHYLEAWGDARADDGTASIVQPLIEPLYGSRSAVEIVGFMAALQETPGEELVRQHWQREYTNRKPTQSFTDFWQTALHDGVIPDTATSPRDVQLKDDWKSHLTANASAATRATSEVRAGEFELAFAVDPTIYDGSFANNGWLQELPKPITRLTWDNAALMSPATAKELGVEFGEYAHGGEHGGYYMPVVELNVDGRTLRTAAWIMPGHADRSITLHLGYGREFAGRVGGNRENPVGVNAYRLRSSQHPWFASGLRVTKTDETHLLACTQQHHMMENRALVRSAGLKEYHEDPHFAKKPLETAEKEETKRAPGPLNFYEPYNYSPPAHRWGMVIDLTSCVGCKACVIACQAENNSPVVGKDQVAAGREMHWIRIDQYQHGPAENPDEFHFQPVTCMHCEHAPCEYVCPVAANVHSSEGLNEMVYNRCVGTRFCSNNCPYKVRRFNFFHYSDYQTPTLRLQYNPEVTVRSRGVMEKCSYCIQRIRAAVIDADREDRPIADGEVVTACQAACPAQAIVFGDLNDPNSNVAKWKSSPLNYGLLEELNTTPRTTYLAALRNPNPELEG